MRHHGHRPHHVHLGHGTTVNVNKTGTSITQKIGNGMTVTTGPFGTTTTTGSGTPASTTTQTRHGRTSTHHNHKKGFFGWL